MEQRRLGRTENQSTVIIFGGFAIGRVTQADADRSIDLALQHGVNHIDVAPTYGDAELRLAPCLARHREGVFLACKTAKRTRDEAWDELKRSLDRMGVASLDLYQLHSVGTMEELDLALAPGGAIEALLEAREQGLVRFLGITGHGLAAPSTHVKALQLFDFDAVMFPLNYILWSNPIYRQDAESLLSLAHSKDVGVQIIKSIAHSGWGDRTRIYRTWYEPFSEQEGIDKALWFALSQPVTAAASVGDINLLPKVLDAAERFRQLDPMDEQGLLLAGRKLHRAAAEPLFAS